MPTNQTTKIEELKKIILPYVENERILDNLSEETDFIKDLNINSSNLVDIILDIEEKYDIVVDNAAMERMTNVKSALEIIDEKLS
ncbi:MAG: acyl carrier protein [Flavobacterium sp.]